MYIFILRFPIHNEKLALTWLFAIGLDDTFQITQNTSICSAHFSNTDYVLENGTFELSDSAVPSVFKIEAEVNENDEVNDDDVVMNYSSTDSTTVVNVLEHYNKLHCIQKGIPETSNQMYLSANTNKHQNGLSSDIHSFEIIRDNTGASNSLNTSNLINKSKNLGNKLTMSVPTSVSKTNELQSIISYPIPKYKHNLHNKCCKKLKLVTRQNQRLLSKIRKMATRQHDILDFKIKFLELKSKVFETEEQLLNLGIDTSIYSAFNMKDGLPKIPSDVGFDILIECKLEELNDQLASSSNSVSQTNGQALAENRTSISEYSNGLNS